MTHDIVGNTFVAVAALFANGVITVLKFLGYLATGGPSMLSETYHSISDTDNQVLLLIGTHDSKRGETQSHPFGHGKSQFFYSFLVSVMLFGITGWESAKYGYDALMHPGHGGGGEALVLLGFEVEPVLVNVAIPLRTIIFESYVFLKANAELHRQIEEYEWSGLVEAFRETSDVTTLTAFAEDTIALVSVVLALAGIGLAELMGSELLDAGAALLIGTLLMGFAVTLTWENKRLLIGESVPVDGEQTLRDVVKNDPRVVHTDHFRASYVGPEELLIAFGVGSDPELDTKELDDHVAEIEDGLKAAGDRVHFVYVEPEL